MQYNTQQKRLPMPEYGRSIQNMVDYALTLNDRQERQQCAQTIIRMMGNMFPQLRDVPEFNHKLWDHLAIMSDFALDITYPCEIIKKEALGVKPLRIPYPGGPIFYRHYGRYIAEMLQIAMDMPNTPEKGAYLFLVASNMKKCYMLWNKDSVEDRKIYEDIREFTRGLISINEEDMRLADSYTAPAPPAPVRRPRNNPANTRRFNK